MTTFTVLLADGHTITVTANHVHTDGGMVQFYNVRPDEPHEMFSSAYAHRVTRQPTAD